MNTMIDRYVSEAYKDKKLMRKNNMVNKDIISHYLSVSVESYHFWGRTQLIFLSW